MNEFKQRDVSEIFASIDGVVVIDHEGIIKSFDSAAQKLFGYDLAEVIDKPLLMLMSKAQQKSHPTYVQTANLKQHQTQNEKLHLEQSIIGLHKSGTPIPLSITVSSDSSGPQIRYTGVLQDLRKHEDRLTTIFQINVRY